MENFSEKSSKTTSPHYLRDADVAKKLADDLKLEYLHRGHADLVQRDEARFNNDLKMMNPAHRKEVAERAATIVNEMRYPEFEKMGRELLTRIEMVPKIIK